MPVGWTWQAPSPASFLNQLPSTALSSCSVGFSFLGSRSVPVVRSPGLCPQALGGDPCKSSSLLHVKGELEMEEAMPVSVLQDVSVTSLACLLSGKGACKGEDKPNPKGGSWELSDWCQQDGGRLDSSNYVSPW
ncbi:hypothetical protein PHYPO_G00203710 [Pangasianodon hypophthalmus]|uniref:Uncharacterized protein n=1 Tax=Pangasianodon hypophthalmus TaxID=310915 RepID=A0A5N5PCF6_PANHP|nr:hypothetical protein PHYPO_G00203710 [Pangasianodon hypophthalmus]